MRLKLYCNRYGHFKDALVCSVSCAYRTRCRDFALFYDEHRQGVDALVAEYFEARREPQKKTEARSETSGRALPILGAMPAAQLAQPAELRALIRLEVLREMAENYFIWVDKEDRAELLGVEEVLKRAERGSKAKHIYKVSQEMELRFQLVPRKRIEKAKRLAADDIERAQARRTAVRSSSNKKPNNAPVQFPAPVAAASPVAEEPSTSAAAPRRARARAK